MKSMKKALAVVLSLIMALSVLALAGSTAAAFDKDKRNHYILPAGSTVPQAAVFALGETVYGAITDSAQNCYKFVNNTSRDVTFAVNTDKKISFTVKSEISTNQFKIGTTLHTSYTIDVPVNGNEIVKLLSVPVGTYIIQVNGTGSGGERTEFSFTSYGTGLESQFKCTINHKTFEMTSGDVEAFRISDMNVNYLNYFWEVLDDSATTDIDETKLVTVNEDGVVSVGFPSTELPFNRNLTCVVRAVFYYSADGYLPEPLTKSCTITLVPPNIFLDPYVTELKLHSNATTTIHATTNVKNGTIDWQSTDPSIASVSSQGVIHTYSKPGTVTLTASLKYNGEVLRVRREIKVTVDDVPYPIAITFGAKSYSLRPGLFDKETNCFITYSDGSIQYADGKNIKFTSSNESVAIVNTKGKIQAVAPGDAVITATTTDGSNISATCPVKVGDNLPPIITLLVTPIKAIIQIIDLIRGNGGDGNSNGGIPAILEFLAGLIGKIGSISGGTQ